MLKKLGKEIFAAGLNRQVLHEVRVAVSALFYERKRALRVI